ncbi:glycerol-3-phosphate dehydrogenase [Ameyamaea chiangmaiensis NBRC 103196]|uniref:Glycerol-3-phosphate dehydrogenase n=1 Tax=Ameyamaea chiangmaiensis TaxID=442969 RepID=A0A850P550_9PROT|nr:glycerol-3-phosphate dehydrogenase [Ameyamaea chiangmaiensis]MBS4073654.1 glycerol-3-phosphate dehydrogenase [Ameyamaea chiangmaiensis]NVN39078.1 glycerol-3-phosphate dehydrogenase [Ameyamaea chiangmaiensis]GBQ68923.1 glycerol-3-phosphate dehydrogenase [Ameyamaea chiangmaiensis NBRC 103196]
MLASNPQTVPPDARVDLLIVGGGVNGTGIARDAVGRGASVMLVEKDDLAGHTSSASTKLIHGGLRYLEYYEFRLVREALIERERLLKIAPHIIWPIRFVLPHSKLVRPAWLLRLGLFLYDHLCPRMTLPKTESVRFDRHISGRAIRDDYARGFIYSDARVLDSRLVVLNAMDARDRGADIRTHTRLVGATRHADHWEAVIEDADGARQTVHARILVNAAGPWVADMLHNTLKLQTSKNVRLVKGSHIVVPRLYDGDHAYILQNPDKRIVFAIPYEQDFTMIGTTDIPFESDPNRVEIDADETRYLCDSVSRYFRTPVKPDDVVWAWSGVRPLYDDAAKDASAVTRDYVLDVDTSGGAAILSIFGGKITTFRKLAEHAIEKLAPLMPVLGKPSWTGTQPLPGGDLGAGGFDGAVARLRTQAGFLDQATAERLVRSYGSCAYLIVGDAATRETMGEDFGAGLTAREIDYLMAQEWVRCADDLLWRRSKLGLHIAPEQAARVEAYIAQRRQSGVPAQPASTGTLSAA